MRADRPLRSIRSFVRRTGNITPVQIRALNDLYPIYGLDVNAQRLTHFCETTGPRYLEIGFGNGASLLSMAQTHPEAAFLGIDVHKPGVGQLLHTMRLNQLENISVVCADALDFLPTPECEYLFSGVYLLFPDPWPKKRHHKRRIVNRVFINLLAKILKPSGFIHTATDWPEYASWITHHFTESNLFTQIDPELVTATLVDHIPKGITHYERRGQRLGHQITELVFQKRQ